MRIALIDAEKTRFPNLALMKLAAWHRKQGHAVGWFLPMFEYDAVYMSKVFSWTADHPYLPPEAIKGGTGFGPGPDLPDEVEHTCPDYEFFGLNYSIGFLTRGCPRSCRWCVVPEKEGAIRPHADLTEFTRHQDVVLLDNNVLAHAHGIEQIEKMARLGLRVDFRQGLDARLIDNAIARRLAALRWLKPVRLACDETGQMRAVGKAVRLLQAAGVTPKKYSCYVLVQDIPDALERVTFLDRLGVDPFAMPYRPLGSQSQPDRELRRFARWVNHKAIFRTVPWEAYQKKEVSEARREFPLTAALMAAQ